MAKLTQGVLVCNMDGRVLLYNQQAQHLLEGPARRSGVGDWIGLGRSVYGIIDEGLIQHALMTVSHARDRGESLLMVPFIATRPGGQLLNVHLIPVSGKGQQWHGYVLTFDDVTRRVQSETHRAMALQSLIEMQRSSVSNIRAAVETMQAYPDMEEDRREAFEQVIHDESLRMSDRLQGLEDDVNRKLQGGWPAQDVLGSDLLAAIERHVHDALGIQIEVSVPLEPLRLRADSYAIARCVIFLIDQLCQSCRAEQVLLTVDRGKSLAALAIEWTGAPLHMEALRTWGMRNVLTTMKGESITLFEVVERHSGAIWPLPPARDGERPRLRVLLPLSDADEQEVIQSVAEAAHDFDFRLSAAAAGSGGVDGLPLNRLSYTVIDTETTGLSPGQGDEIIAIGAIRIVNGRILGRENFDSFVRPRVPVSGASQAIHGITPEMLRGQPRIEEVLPNLQRFVEDTVIVGHNIDFDMRFFEESAVRTGVRFANPVLDTLKLEYLVNPNQEEKSLEAMATRLGIGVTGRHTALGDALTTAEVFLALMPLLEQRGVRTLAEAQAASEATPYARLKY
jgi:DNA polymerase-3 subunit epsilon